MKPALATVAGVDASRPQVSLTMIVKNEEANLAACLASVRDLVDEMVVVDTGSTDRTSEIAAQYGARVVDFTWQDNFAAARNEALRHAAGEWILWLDADEYLDETNRERLRTLLANLKDDNAAYVMRLSSELEAGVNATAVVDQVRLFRSASTVRWQHRVHEQILPSRRQHGAVMHSTDIVITHRGYADPPVQPPKLERNLRLLKLALAETPDDPFVLYNLGALYLTQGNVPEALILLRRGLEWSHPRDNLVPKLHFLITCALHQLGEREQALAMCRQARLEYPEDTELLFWEAMMLRERADLAGAEACWLQVLQAPPRMHFTGLDASMQGYRVRHLLAETYRDQGRWAEAETQWRLVVAECPGFAPAWRNLAELCLAQQRWPELEAIVAKLQQDPQQVTEGKLLLARGQLARKEFAAARQQVEGIIGEAPQALLPKVVLSYVLLQEGKDWLAAEKVLREILTLDPNFTEASHNLRVLLEQQGKKWPDEHTATSISRDAALGPAYES